MRNKIYNLTKIIIIKSNNLKIKYKLTNNQMFNRNIIKQIKNVIINYQILKIKINKLNLKLLSLKIVQNKQINRIQFIYKVNYICNL